MRRHSANFRILWQFILCHACTQHCVLYPILCTPGCLAWKTYSPLAHQIHTTTIDDCVVPNCVFVCVRCGPRSCACVFFIRLLYNKSVNCVADQIGWYENTKSEHGQKAGESKSGRVYIEPYCMLRWLGRCGLRRPFFLCWTRNMARAARESEKKIIRRIEGPNKKRSM